MIISLIAAMEQNRGIGLNNQLPWHLPADLSWFKKITMGHYLLVGRKTYQSIGRPLPGRKMIILTRSQDFSTDNSLICGSVEQALDLARESGENELFVIGGEDIYLQTLPLADHLYLTRVHAKLEVDAYFPEVNEEDWFVVCEQERPADQKNLFTVTFQLLTRKRSPNF
jgi:dihydrofolate reductase